MLTLISCAPFVPSLWGTLHNSLHMRSLASAESFASSGNFRCVFQFTICRALAEQLFDQDIQKNDIINNFMNHTKGKVQANTTVST